MDYDVTAHRHSQHLGGGPAEAGKPASVTAKAAAIDAAQSRPLTWKNVVKQTVVVAVAGAAIYLVLPKLMVVLGSWPRLSTLNPIWFTVALAAELISFICNFALQRLALRTRAWFAVVTAALAGNAVTDSLPGGDAAGAAVQFRMLTTAGFDTGTAVGGLTAFSLLGVGGLLALPLIALPAILAGAPAQPRPRPYRPAWHRRVRRVRRLRHHHPARRLAAGRGRARGTARAELGDPRPPAAGDRLGQTTA